MSKTFCVLLLGEPQVGKTQLLNVWLRKSFKKNYEPTSGVETYENQVNGKKIKIIDTSTKGKDINITKSFFPRSDLIIIVQAINDSNSVNKTEQYVQMVREANASADILVFNNKADLLNIEKEGKHHQKVRKYCKENGIQIYNTSAFLKEINENDFNESIESIIGDFIKTSQVNQHQSNSESQPGKPQNKSQQQQQSSSFGFSLYENQDILAQGNKQQNSLIDDPAFQGLQEQYITQIFNYFREDAECLGNQKLLTIQDASEILKEYENFELIRKGTSQFFRAQEIESKQQVLIKKMSFENIQTYIELGMQVLLRTLSYITELEQ